MSLFPAYESVPDESKETVSDTTKHTSETNTWLTNTSFKINTDILTQQSNRDETEKQSIKRKKERHKTKRKKEKIKRSTKRRESSSSSSDQTDDVEQRSDLFEVDKSCHREYLTVRTISRPAVPKYRYSRRMTIGAVPSGSGRRHQSRRYFTYVVDDETDVAKVDRSSDTYATKAEEDLSSSTANFNRLLADDPQDVDRWLEYVRFQDAVFEFEKTYKKGSRAKGARVTADRKLSILEKAIQNNADCEKLHRERISIVEDVYPADELSGYLKVLVEKDPSNIINWQGYVESVQCSMSHCNTESVLSVYNKCLSTLHQLRRNSVLEKNVLEESILRILYQCGLFLKQAGLWEQLWTLLRLYLELNLSPNDKSLFNISSSFEENELLELEDVVLKSELPIHELWLRVEKLRESCHWLPWIGNEPSCEDPQRLVFTEDVSDFIHPITSPGNATKLIVMVVTLMKVPLLPCRHSTMKEFGLDYVPWAVDSVETLLSSFFPYYTITMSNNFFLRDISALTIGPQYLKTHPGQEEYLNFVTRTLQNCARCLKGDEQTAVLVWWLRFERLLVVLNNEGRFKMPAGRKKQLKSQVKELLKSDGHRNNVVLFSEYALIEYELGNFDTAVNVLTMALSTNNNTCTKASRCLLLRLLVELHLKNDSTNKSQLALKYLICLALDKPATYQIDLNEPSLIDEALLMYKRTTADLLLQSLSNLSPEEHFLPDFTTDWIICHCWLLYLNRGLIEAGVFMEDTMSTLRESCGDGSWHCEVLMEWNVAVLFKSCKDNVGSGMHKLLDDALNRGLEQFPSNVLMLTVATNLQSVGRCDIKLWWRLTNVLLKTGHALPVLFVVLMALQRMSQLEADGAAYAATSEYFAGANLSDVNVKNRVKSLFQKITKKGMCTKRCGLIWRLYLRFLYINCDLIDCRKSYYAAVEECPWLKALYIDAAVYVPAELSPIQDLIIEKQLRLHITPEELDILRN